MALLTATISGKITDLFGVESSYASVKMSVASSNGTLPDGSDVRVGDIYRTAGEDGLLTITDVTQLPQTGYEDYCWNILIIYSGTHGNLSISGVQITGDTTWGQILKSYTSGQPFPPNAVDLIAGMRDEVEADRIAAETAAETAAADANAALSDDLAASQQALSDTEAARDTVLSYTETEDDMVSVFVSDPTAATKKKLDDQYPDKPSPFFARFGSGLYVFDDFKRPDIDNFAQFFEGYNSKSGHAITADGAVSTNSIAAISNNAMVWTDGTPGGVPIRIANIQTVREPNHIGASVTFTPETTTGNFATNPYGANAVIGCSPVSFAQGSVQVGLFKHGIYLFVVPNPIVGPYPSQFSYEFPVPLVDDGITEYHFYMQFDRTSSTVTVEVPGKLSPVTISDPLFAQYWGSRFSWQERRGATTDARVRFHAIGAATPSAADSGIGAALNLPYSQNTFLSTNPPAGYAITDPEISFWGAPTGGWNNSTTVSRTNVLMSLWNQSAGNSHRGFCAYVAGANGRPAAYLSRDGAEQVISTCSTQVPAAALGVKIKYSHTTGNVQFWYTYDDASVASPTWTELGTVGGNNVFAVGTLLFTPPRRTQLQVGTRDRSSTLLYGGAMSRAIWSDAGKVIADCDMRTVWLSTRKTDPEGNVWYLQGAGWTWSITGGGKEMLATDNKWTGVQYVPSTVQRQGNRIDLVHIDLHPSSRPRSHFFSGNSHPLSEYFPDLASAQAQYPFATSLSDETDWAAIQSALNSVTSYPRGWVNGSDWRQYGNAKLVLPIGVIAMINRPLTKAANTNKNYTICSETLQGARIDYTGSDGGRIFDFDKDSVGSTLDINNLVLNKGGIRLAGPYRGDIRLGNGCLITDTPHPAVQLVDADHAGNQVGVVGVNVWNLYTEGCAGGVWQTSSTATITTVRDSRFLSNTDVGLKIDGSTDCLVENVDFTGMAVAKAAAGNGPYMQISANADTTNNIDIRDIRFGSEVSPVGSQNPTSAPPKEYLLIGEPTGTSAPLGIIRLRKCAFRTPAVPTPTMGRAAIQVNGKATLDIDDCDFGKFYDFLVDEKYVTTETIYYTGAFQSKWGARNTVDPGHLSPIFSRGGVTFLTPGGTTPVDPRAGVDPGDGENLVPALISGWSTTNTTVGPLTTGGPNGMSYFPLTRTAAGQTSILTRTITMTAGKKYSFGITARKGTMRTLRMRAAIGTTVMADQRELRLDSDWVTYWFRIPYVATTGTCAVSFYLDDEQETGAGGTMDALLPFVSEGWNPRIPRTGMRLTERTVVPNPAVRGMTYLADGVGWNPLALVGGLPYMVLYNGTSYVSLGGATLTAPDIQAFTTVGNSTWTKPVGAVRVEAIAISAGAGGGSGRRGTATTVRAGGGGGGGGVRVSGVFNAADLGATENVTVGLGGAGGPAIATDDTSGSDGTGGGASYFGAASNRWLVANVPGGGTGGLAAATTGGTAGAPGGSVGATGSATGLAGGSANTSVGRGTNWTAGSGGGGGGCTTSNITSAGGTGALGVSGSNVAPTAGPAGGASPGGNGTVPLTNSRMGGGGGSGGGSSINSAAGAGGNGAAPGGGGGGGGASLNGFASGAGGNGGDGAVYVITYFS